MKYMIACLFALFAISGHAQEKAQEIPRVTLQTTMGSIVLELMPHESPIAANNFLNYAESGFYEGTVFHRVVKGFVVQGGGYTANYEQKSTNPAIKNEANNGVKNTRGTVAMARSSDPNSATSQFFINVNDNGFLDHKSPTRNGWGYAVFAKVVEGMDIVDRIQDVETGAAGAFRRNVPVNPISIEAVTIDSVMRMVEIQEKPESLEEPIELIDDEPIIDNDDGDDTTEDSAADELNDSDVTEEDDDMAEQDSSASSNQGEAIPAPDAPSKPDMPEPMSY
ncbi:MAG: peptidylprolyl isomerase [Thiotrichaceae bacterium]|nr:peptidylprolyl isomerase [Thiotrichaceae bacterium]